MKDEALSFPVPIFAPTRRTDNAPVGQPNLDAYLTASKLLIDRSSLLAPKVRCGLPVAYRLSRSTMRFSS